MLLVVLSGCLLFVLKLNVNFVLAADLVSSNSLWGLFASDRMATFFAVLTSLLVFICVSLLGPRTYNPFFYLIIFLSLSFFLSHTFFSLNMLVFYAMFEFTLIPMFLLILLWGSRQRKLHAMYMFFFYTVVGSIFLLGGLLLFHFLTGSFIITSINFVILTANFFAFLVWTCFFLGFAFKVPIVPFHTWLPEAHVEAPTVGSMILAGLLLKVGTFGMLRFMFPGLNYYNLALSCGVFALAVFSIFYASLIAIRQLDMKKIIAYSSVAHMGLVIIGLFSLTFLGFVGSYFTMISHGVVASALFFLVGVLYERYHTRNLSYYGGLISLMPVYGVIFFLFILANIGFPFTSNFIGELLILVGITSCNIFVALCCLFSVVLPPIYSV